MPKSYAIFNELGQLEIPAGSGGQKAGLASVDALIGREQLLRQSLGFYAETLPCMTAFLNTGLPVSGTLYLAPIALNAGDLVSNLTVMASVVGAGLTLSRLTLYTKAGQQLAASADVSAAMMASIGGKSCAMATPFVIQTSDTYYVGPLFVGTTPPTLYRRSTPGFAVLTSGGASISLSQTAQADAQAQATLVSGQNFGFWVGVS
jgi:hypothetical protein